MLRWGILSTGNIARQFAASFKTAQHGLISAVGSRSAESARTFASAHGIPTAVGSYEELIQNPDVDAVYNALPNTLHHLWTIKALRAGKHVLCEKPLAPTLAEAQEMFDVAKSTGLLLAEAFMYRSHPLTLAYLGDVRSGKIGQVQLIRASFCFKVGKQQGNIRFDTSLAGGALMDVGCYCIDFAQLITGEMPTSFHGHVTRHPSGVDSLAAVTLAFPSGALAAFTVGMTVQADNTASICGSDGFIEVPVPWKPPVTGAIYRIGQSIPPRMDVAAAAASSNISPSAAPPNPASSPRQTITIDAGKDLYALEADDFALAVAGKQPLRITPAESLSTCKILEKLRSI